MSEVTYFMYKGISFSALAYTEEMINYTENGFQLLDNDIVVVTYQDLRGSVEKICQFLRKKLNSQQIDSVMDYSSFQKMKEKNMSNLTRAPDYLFDHSKGKFMWKGFSMMSELYLTYKGIFFSSMETTLETLNYVENEFQLLDDDVLLVTYPKSGTVWMLEILGLIQHNGDPSWVRSTEVWERAPWLYAINGLERALNFPSPRLLASHLPFHISPKSLLQSKAKVIYTLRNPKDVLISYYHFAKFYKGFKDPGTVEEFLEEFLSGNVPIGSWFDHVKGWLQMKDRTNFFFITYEELQKDLRGSVEKICHFLGKDLNRQQIDAVVDNTSFQKMKDNKMSNFSLAPETYFNHKKGKFMRKGICGDWKNHLTVAQSEYFDGVYQKKMKGMNVAFPWN